MPGLAYRSVILVPQDLTAPWIPALSEAGLNTLLLHAVRLPDDITQLIMHRHSDPGRALLAACAEGGIAVEYQLHTASWLLPRALFGRHPEWFRADRHGRRTPDANFCVSSDAAWEYIEPRILELASNLPSGTGRHLWFPDDVTSGACHCERCAALTESDQALLYANRLATALRSTDPAARCSYLAYHSTLAPPERVEPAAGVTLEFAPIGRCYRHALDDADCAINRRQLHLLRDAVAFFGAPFWVTEYWLDVSLHSGYRRPGVALQVSEEVIARDVACYRKLGCEGIATYAVYADGDYWTCPGPPPLAAYGRALRGGGK